MLSPHAEKWGDASPRPPPIDTRASNTAVIVININILIAYILLIYLCLLHRSCLLTATLL